MNGKTAKLIRKVASRACPPGIDPGVRNNVTRKLKNGWYAADKNERAKLRRRYEHWLHTRAEA
jgi:hypothetical protein